MAPQKSSPPNPAAAPQVSVWVRPPKERKRGTAPGGLSRQRIVQAAVELLDAEGDQGFSMRRLAAELGVTPMSVYWYVDNKGELLELALDEALGEMRIPPLAEDGDWRDHLRVMAHEYRDFYRRHLWATRVAGEVLPLGPNALFFSSSAIAAAERTGLPPEQCGGALGLLFQFVYGFATSEAQQLIRVRESGLTEEAYHEAVMGLASDIDPRHLTNAERVMPHKEGTTLSTQRDDTFAASLEIALDGIEARVRRVRAV
ncbi:TetR/AcrR family transcriptional regulator [Streptacidiphilus pinicola]|uniref:TetR/AcrR family transcriptional regulator n=1 Tax=Streptacidiphilus pinicola TaxID=2219663 RepID=A0A2X0KGL6_9ACTN|nr:TetR/AcrR family transcriptional regulator [Streptacidiphilus pinicola]RAG85990.1 TetR/AcrR family transcriptional regulator [Streptacidiphilus pinicola]